MPRGTGMSPTRRRNRRPKTDPEALAHKLARAHDRMWCDHAFYIGGTMENVAQLAELERLPGCCGVKVFMGASTGSLLGSLPVAIFYSFFVDYYVSSLTGAVKE